MSDETRILVHRAANAVKKFVPVRCLSCGKTFTYAAPGSTIRFRCRGCKTQQIVEVLREPITHMRRIW